MALDQHPRTARRARSAQAVDPVAAAGRTGLPVEIRVAGVELDGTVLDLGEAGLLVAVRTRGRAPDPAGPMHVRIPLVAGPVHAEVRLTRRAGRGRDVDEWALRFTRLPYTARNLVRSYVFATLRDRRSLGLL